MTVDDAEVEIDGKLWEFVLYKFKDGTYDLLFKPDAAQALSDEYLDYAGTIIVDGELGEERRMELVGDIEVVKAWDEGAMRFARKLEPGLLARLLAPQSQKP